MYTLSAACQEYDGEFIVKLKFFVINWRGSQPQGAEYPYVVLEMDNWDDYGFKTLFHPTIYESADRVFKLRDVKILKLGQVSRTELDGQFGELDETYCSLGQELAYYESLLELSEEIRIDYLSAIRDVVADQNIYESFRNENGFADSILRFGSAELALRDAPALLSGASHDEKKLNFTFFTKFGENEFPTHFRYRQINGLPGRINAVIGYNGCGKTQLLANLAWVARMDLKSRKLDDTIEKFGRFDDTELRFGSVVAVSYSAFDTFELPWTLDEDNQGKPSTNGDSRDRNTQFDYTYCGLRRQYKKEEPRGLKDADDIVDDVKFAIERINTKRRKGNLTDALKPLRDEPSFKRSGYELDLLAEDTAWTEEFRILSSGHKISVNIIVQLVAALQRESLVLIDEPEAHLHPPLLAALMKGIGIVLEAQDSYAVIATHSPVVLQEIAGRYAHVLQRHGTRNSVREPSIETFGENVGLLTSHVFNLDNTGSDHLGILNNLASGLSFSEVEALFEHGMSTQARALVLQIKSN